MTVTASIDIAVSPADVRAKFLDFPALPNYSTTFFGSITPLGPLEPSQKIRVNFAKANQTMDATIKENTPQAFAWTGSIPFLFTGTHKFLFEPSSTVPGGCRFTQSEEFSGALGWLMGENAVARQMGFAEKTRKGWEGYNEDFKAWCERSSSG